MESVLPYTTLTMEAKTFQVEGQSKGGNLMESAPLHTFVTMEAKT